MAKIVKRKHWNEFHGPARPSPPKEPKEFHTNSKQICSGSEVILFRDIKIPEGYTADDLSFETEYDSYYIKVFLHTKIKNESYLGQLIVYNKDLVKYEEDMKNWNIEIIEYNAWKKQSEDELLKRKIQDAKVFLKKHGESIK